MHEMSLAQGIVEIVAQEMAKWKATRLRSVRIAVGQMCAVMPESLSFCFDIITAGTEMEEAKLIIENVPLRGRCHGCKHEFDIMDYVFICPACGGTNVRNIAGQGLRVVELEVD